jgi:surfactin synthase thioesterase subunit
LNIFSFRWKELTTKEDLFRVKMFPAGHNFQAECQTQVLQTLKEDFNKFFSK